MELSHTDVEGIWQKDGIRVKPNNHWRVSTNGLVHSLTLSHLTLEDTGTIVFSAEGVRCTSRLTVKGTYSSQSTFTLLFWYFYLSKVSELIETPVTLLRPLVDVRVEEEFPATLECEFSRQNVDVKWLKVKLIKH